MPGNILRTITAAAYPFVRAGLFRLPPETAHHLSLAALRWVQDAPLASFDEATFGPAQPVELMGLRFPNRLGLAAGLDKGAHCVDGLGALGFGHIEVGTLTPRPQPGNPKPRLFRLKPAEAIINRMGFNNPGIAEAVHRLEHRIYPGVLGVNIGKNFDTPNEDAVSDYQKCLAAAYHTADYVTINLSSPNTKALRELQMVAQCRPFLEALLAERDRLADIQGKRLPLAIKIAPDLEDDHVKELADLFVELGLDAVIATNTTIDRSGVGHLARAGESGGLSGRPLRQRATEIIHQLRTHLGDRLPIIGVGGISQGADALEKLQAGASLVQIYTGFIYRGSALIHDILTTLDDDDPITRRPSARCSSRG